MPYLVYGLLIESTLALPYLTVDASATDVRIERRPAGFFNTRRESEPSPGKFFYHERLSTGDVYLLWPRLFEFVISATGCEIFFNLLIDGSQLALETYLLGQVMSSLLIMRGQEPFHATVVSRHGRAVAFLGDSGFGKTTLASYLLTEGYQLVTDDLLVMSRGAGGYTAHHGVPRVKLYPDSAAAIPLGPAHGAMNPYTQKCVLGIDQALFQAGAVPLTAFFSIVSSKESPGDEVKIRRLSSRQAFESLTANCYNALYSDPQRLGRHFEIVGAIARNCPIFSLEYPRRFDQLYNVAKAVEKQLRALENSNVCIDSSFSIRTK